MRWPSWTPGPAAGLCSASRQPAPPGAFLLGSFPVALPQAKGKTHEVFSPYV